MPEGDRLTGMDTKEAQNASAPAGLLRDPNAFAARGKGFDKANFFEVGLTAFTWKGQQCRLHKSGSHQARSCAKAA